MNKLTLHEVNKAKRRASRSTKAWTKVAVSINQANQRQRKLAEQARRAATKAQAKQAKQAKAEARYEAQREKLYAKLADIAQYETEGGRYNVNTRAKLARIQRALDASPTDLKAINQRISAVSKEAGKQRRAVQRQHNLIETRLAEAREIEEAGGRLAPEYAERLNYMKALHEANKSAAIPENLMSYIRNQRKGQVLRAKGAYVGTVTIDRAISASGNVHTYDEATGQFTLPAGFGTAIATVTRDASFQMEKGIVIPVRYKQSERQAVATYIKDKLEEMREKKAKGEVVLTGSVLENALVMLEGFGVLKYNPNKGLESLKFNPKNIDKIVEDPNQHVDADLIDEVLYTLAGYERFSEEAAAAVNEQRLFNSYTIRQQPFKKFAHGIINELLRSSSIWNKFHPYLKGRSPKGSEEEQEEMDEVIGKARAIEDYFPQSFIDFTYAVMHARELRGYTPLADKWVEVMLYIYSQVDDLDRGTITDEDLEKEVSKRLPRG